MIRELPSMIQSDGVHGLCSGKLAVRYLCSSTALLKLERFRVP